MPGAALEAVFASPTGEVAPAVWDELASSRFYSTSAWLHFCARGSAGRSGAVVVGTPDSPRVVAPVAEITPERTSPYSWSQVLETAGLPPIGDSALMLGPRQGYQGDLLTGGRDADPADAGQLLDALHAAPHANACVAMYLRTPDASAFVAAGVAGQPLFLDADACFDIAGHTWESWLDGFPSKRRIALQHERTAFEAAGYRIEHSRLSDVQHELAPLALATQSRYGHASALEAYERMLAAHVDAMGDRARVAICRIGQEAPAGFCVYYEWHGTVYLRWAGFDYARLHDAYEYFNLVYYTHLDRAAEAGTVRLDAGVKALEAKVLRGATLRPRWFVNLSHDSALAGHSDTARSWNRARVQPYLEDPRLRRGVVVPAAWSAFA